MLRQAGTQEPSGPALPEEWACCCWEGGGDPGASREPASLPTSILGAPGRGSSFNPPFPPEDNLTFAKGVVAGRGCVCQTVTPGEFGVIFSF